MGARLDFDVGASAAVGGKAWKAVRPRRVVLTYGSVAGNSAGEAGEDLDAIRTLLGLASSNTNIHYCKLAIFFKHKGY